MPILDNWESVEYVYGVGTPEENHRWFVEAYINDEWENDIDSVWDTEKEANSRRDILNSAGIKIVWYADDKGNTVYDLIGVPPIMKQ